MIQKYTSSFFLVLVSEIHYRVSLFYGQSLPAGISDPEANARLIAASPELFTALVWVVEALRGTEIFMAGQGLDTKELDEIVRSANELLERIDGE